MRFFTGKGAGHGEGGGAMIFAWIVAGIWAAVLSLGVIQEMKDHLLLAVVVHGTMAYGPLALLFWLGRKGKADTAKLAEDMAPAQGKGYRHAEGSSAIAVDTEAKTVTMVAGENRKTYPYDSIRSWEVVKETAGEVVGGGLPGVGAQLRANKRARMATGMFVTVKDIDYPIWRIEMSQTATQHRWMEIFRQEVKEGGA